MNVVHQHKLRLEHTTLTEQYLCLVWSEQKFVVHVNVHSVFITAAQWTRTCPPSVEWTG